MKKFPKKLILVAAVAELLILTLSSQKVLSFSHEGPGVNFMSIAPSLPATPRAMKRPTVQRPAIMNGHPAPAFTHETDDDVMVFAQAPHPVL